MTVSPPALARDAEVTLFNVTVNVRKLILSPICWFLTGWGQPDRGAVDVCKASAVAGATRAVTLAPLVTRLFFSSPAGRALSPLPVVGPLERCCRDPYLLPSLPEPGPATRGEGSGQVWPGDQVLLSDRPPWGWHEDGGEKRKGKMRGQAGDASPAQGCGRGGFSLDPSGLRNPWRHANLDVSSKRS